MDNYDDYFDDSFVLNEDDLALLDAEEQKLTGNHSEANIAQEGQLTKRRKTLHRYEDGEPDITLRINGTYGLKTDIWALCEEGSSAPSHSHILRNLDDSNKKNQITRRSTAGVVKPTVISNNTQKPVKQADKGRGNKNGNSTQAIANTRVQPEDGVSHDEIGQLRAQIENLMREQVEAKDALKALEVARFAKEGEVSILRKKVEKAAEQHASDLLKLKEIKESADAEKARLQKEMHDQRERLHTELAFRKHEADSAVRRPPSVRPKRIVNMQFATPAPAHSSSNKLFQTHAKGASSSHANAFTTTQRNSSQSKLAVETKIPGFENTFLQSSPLKSPRRRAAGTSHEVSFPHTPRKRVAKVSKAAGNEGRISGLFSPVKSPPFGLRTGSGKIPSLQTARHENIQEFDADMDMDVGNLSPSRRPRISRTGSSPAPERADLSSVLGSDFIDEVDEEESIASDVFEGVDWLDELHSMLFCHENGYSETSTFQFLLSAHVSSMKDYQARCSAILEALGNKYRYYAVSDFLDDIMQNLFMMTTLLLDSCLYDHLGALLELLKAVVVHMPAPAAYIFHSSEDAQDCLTICLRNVVKACSTSSDSKAGVSILLPPLLALLETLAWLLPEHLSDRFFMIAKEEQVLSTLLDNKQSLDTHKLMLRLIVVLATRSRLCDSFISDGQSKEGSRLSPSLLGKICTILSQTSHDQCELASLILTFFDLLVENSADCREATQTQSNLIPCLVFYLSRLTCFLWEDGEFVGVPDHIARGIVMNIQQSVLLLHRLIFSFPAEGKDARICTDIDLRQKLYQAPAQMFNGLAHVFTVTISRLSYADPPEWLASELQSQVLKITEPSRDLMDLVVEGPESDSIWAVYQGVDVNDETTHNELDEILSVGDEGPSLEI